MKLYCNSLSWYLIGLLPIRWRLIVLANVFDVKLIYWDRS